MAQVKVTEITGKALNYAVHHAEGMTGVIEPVGYCGLWVFGGPIIEREGLSLAFISTHKLWVCNKGLKIRQNGQTPLIAAMRCYVASNLGDVVEVPDELIIK